MIEWTALDDEGGYRRLQIEAPWDEIADEYRDLVTRYAASVRLPGFRPGKTPRGVVSQKFHREIIEDLSIRAAQRLGAEAAAKAGIEALGPLEAFEIECDKGKPFRARVRYLRMPEFRVPEPAELASPEDGTDPRDRISRRLLELAPFELHADVVQQELESDGLGDSVPDSAAWRVAAERVRLMVILKRIAKREGIEVDEKDVNARIAEKAVEFGTTRESLQKELAKGGGLQRLKDMLLAESTLEYLVENQGSTTNKGA
jgi:FKBP-type peptidyl-prolyl cis-trans isomerase (trigger factor)